MARQIGRAFKQVRRAQGITLKEAARGICSIQMLSRWENNTGNIDFEKALRLFERVNLSATEYIYLAELDSPDNIAVEIECAFKEKKSAAMRQIAQKLLAAFHQDGQVVDLDYAAIACSRYFKLAHRNIFPLSDQNKLNKQLTHITVWGKEYLSLFGNIMAVVSPKIIYQISFQVLENIAFIQKAGPETLHFAISTLFEAVIALFTKDSVKFAAATLRQINQIDLPDKEMLLIVGRKFLNAVLAYKEGRDAHTAAVIISFLADMGMQTQADYFAEILAAVKNAG